MNTIVRAVESVWLAVWPVLGGLTFLLFVFASLPPRGPKPADMVLGVPILGGAVLLWVGIGARQWNRLRKLANPRVVDTSMALVPLPDGLAGAADELRRLGFAPIGQYAVETAWPEGPARVYATYLLPEHPGLWADISHATSLTTFCSYWANGAVLETTFPALKGANVPGIFPGWRLVQHSGDGIEAALALHLATIARYEPIGGPPLAVPDLATTMKLLVDAMRRTHEFQRAKLRSDLAPMLFVVPAWLGLAWFVISG